MSTSVAPRRGAWIEIVKCQITDSEYIRRTPQGCVDRNFAEDIYEGFLRVAPRRGAWIEISITKFFDAAEVSHPAGVRG